MRTRTARVCLAAGFVLVMLVPSLHADWAGGGIELCTYSASQSSHEICSDGDGGAIVVWQDEREGADTWDVFAQRFDADGNILWDAGGVNVSQQGSSQFGPELVSDGNGGAIIVYINDRTGNYDLTAQRIRPNGSLAWAVGGVTVCGASYMQTLPRMISDGAGGAIVVWQDYRSNTTWDIYAARIDSTGSMPWTVNGVAVCSSAGNQNYPELTTDGSSGAIFVWRDTRNGNDQIYAQRLNFLGGNMWPLNGISVASGSGYQYEPCIASDLDGGAVIAWTSGITSNKDIYAERMLSDGTRAWDPGTGVPVCTATQIQSDPQIASDGAGGAIIAWMDLRDDEADIYAHHIDFAGGTTWPENGAYICYAAGTQHYPEIVSDGAGGAIILWTDWRFTNNYEIFGQHIDAGGTTHWFVNGENLTSWPADQQAVRMIADGEGGIIAAWWDERDMSNPYKIYAQRYDRYGYWGYPAPVITDASDVPADQGGQVQLTWAPIRMDEFPGYLVTHYTIWRSTSAPVAMVMAGESGPNGNGAPLFVSSPCEIGLDFEGKAYRTDIAFAAAAAWEWVASVDAHYWDEYAYTCPTVHDFIEGVEDGMHWFVVTANTADPFTFWDSDPASAYSVDDLSPCAPLGLAAAQSFEPEGLVLTWDPNEEDDLGGYNIYRGTYPQFEPSEDNLIGSTCEPAVFDPDWSWDSGFCYKVTAVDIHGNESDHAAICDGQVTGDDPIPLPDATFLAQNYPNPFNPATTIAFGLKERGAVSLRIYDAAGRLVRELAGGTMDAGRYDIAWNGLDDSGASVASGVYFYMLKTKEFEETRKMVLLK